MGRGRFLGGCAWLLGVLALLQTLYLRALPPPRPPPAAPRAPRGVLDASGTFRVYRDVLGPPPGWARAPGPELVLATHGSPGRAAAALGGPWGGPLSVAVFGVPRAGLEELMAILGGPCRALRGRLRLHVVLGAAGPPPRPPSPPRGAPRDGRGCRGALARLAAADPPSYSLEAPYPGNLLRNVAWEGAAGGGGPAGRPPPKSGQRFVLLVDADVEPSPGLRRGFLELLRDGGLDPKNWGGRGGLPPDPRGAEGGRRDPEALGGPGALGGAELRDPRAGGVPEGLRDPGDVPKDPKTLWGPNGLGDPQSFRGPGVPSDPKGDPNDVLSDPRAPSDPKSDPNVLSDLKSDLKSDPNALSDPKSDPNVPSDPKSDLKVDPNDVLSDPQSLSDPLARNDLNALSDPNAPGAPNGPGAPEPPWARVLFVLPAFEVRGGLRPPATKAELLQLWAQGGARPFYGALCPRCQAPTAFGRWRALPPAPRPRVAYEAAWRDPWEPFYVAPAHGVPPFDESFLQYGFNRISQACELHVAGFRFAVLDGAFVTHRGFKEPGGFHRGREAELGLNRRRFRAFRQELRLRYPRSERRC